MVYAPAAVARGLARRLAGRRLPDGPAARLGLLLRWLYGPALGAVYAAGRSRLPAPVVAGGVSFGAAIYLFELLAMPAFGATPPPRRWPRRELALLLAHTGAFGIGTSAAFELLGPGWE